MAADKIGKKDDEDFKEKFKTKGYKFYDIDEKGEQIINTVEDVIPLEGGGVVIRCSTVKEGK